jgi:glycosyltransferase involved in cell wall biosynthesis
MRILHIDCGREMRGGQWQVLRLLRGLRERGCESILLTSAPEGPLAKLAAADGFPVERVNRRFPPADLVHAHDARGHTWAALLARTPIVVARRVAFPIKAGWLSRWKYGRAAHFIAVSGYVAGILRAAGVSSDKISVVYDGVPLLRESSRTGGVIAPASGDPEKGADLARAAWPEVEFSSNLERDLQTARILLYLTRNEGLGSGALLGMSAGIAVIASRVGGLAEIIEDGVNGMLVENNATAIAQCVLRLNSEPELAARFAAAARRTVEERFTVERMVEDTREVYRRILHV